MNRALTFLSLLATTFMSCHTTAAEKQATVVRVACIGDSITFGNGIKDRTMAYPAQLQQLLGDGYEVQNFGNSGRSILKKSMRGSEQRGFIFMKEHVDALAFKPDIVVSNLGINDLMDFDKFGDDFIADYVELLRAYQELDNRPRLIVWTPLAPLFEGHNFHNDPNIDRINAAISRVASEMQIESIDLAKPFRGKANLFPDKIHPNAAGATVIAEQVAKAVRHKDAPASKRALTGRPNVLFIVSEDNSEQIGCYGEKRVHTPHLDSLAASGVRYERAYVPYSVCSPSRAAFLTGLYTRQNGHIGLATHRFAFYKNFKTMPAYLQEAGYYTGFIGKTHVNPERLVEDYIDFRGVAHANFSNTHSIEDYAKEARTIFENAIAEEKPFLAIINYSDAHRKFIGTSKAGYPTVNVEGTEAEPLPWIGVDTPRLRQEMRNYLNCMNRLDEGIGLVLNDLEKLKLRDNTLIIYIADHGGDFPRGKTTCYEGGVKVPMIVNYPKTFPEGKAESSLVSTLDILPTMLQAAGIEIPKELMGWPLQTLQDPDGPRRNYIHTFNTGSSANILHLTFGVCDERYKLIYNPVRATNTAAISRYANTAIPEALWDPGYIDPPEYELYDLETDPYEFTNLANHPDFRSVGEELILAMKEFQEEIDDPFLDPKNIQFYMEEMRDPSRHPKKRSREIWSHLKEFYPR